MRRSAAVLAMLAMASCASLSKQECLAGDWRVIGFEDGAEGRPAERIGEHSRACAQHGVAPDMDIWRIGYDEGLKTYCTRDNGFRVGVAGATYYGVCSGPDAQMFVAAYSDGRAVYDVRQAAGQIRSELTQLDSEIDRAREARDYARKDADMPGISDEQRNDYLDKAERLSEEIGDLQRQHRNLEYDLRRVENDLYDVEATMRRYYPEWSGY